MLRAAPDLEPLHAFLAGKRIAVLTGAGCSTDSGIPDYGGLESPTRKSRIQYREFVGDHRTRARYWARATIGWRGVAGAQPNRAHVALARLEAVGRLTGIITQNVDGLHRRAGSRRIVELHGSLGRVVCLGCRRPAERTALQSRLEGMNPWLRNAAAPDAPDGDAELTDARLAGLRVPACQACGGVLKPDVVFFGETVPKERVAEAWRVYEAAEALLVVGSSLAVFSGFRFVLRASQEGKPVAVVNLGPTRADDRIDLKIVGNAGEVLHAVAAGAAGEVEGSEGWEGW